VWAGAEEDATAVTFTIAFTALEPTAAAQRDSLCAAVCCCAAHILVPCTLRHNMRQMGYSTCPVSTCPISSRAQRAQKVELLQLIG
jgi:hypothetical protein